MAGSSSDTRADRINKIIDKVYYESGALGSIKRTLADAKEKDSTITEAEVKKWKDQNVHRKINLRGFNSFIASKPREEYQIDIMQMLPNERGATVEARAAQYNETQDQRNLRRRVIPQRQRDQGEGSGSGIRGPKVDKIEPKKKARDEPNKFGYLFVDIFTKYVVVIPLESNNKFEVLPALKKGIEKMGGNPETIYSDVEPAVNSNVVLPYLKEQKIRLIFTRGHANVAERHIRTIKDMINKRLEYKGLTKMQWESVLDEVLEEYNTKMVHSAHDLTPDKARDPRNLALVKGRLEVGRISNRKYPRVEVGDTVKVHKKKDKLFKEGVPIWRPEPYTVIEIIESKGQKFYNLDPVPQGRDMPVPRADILLIPN